MAFGVISPLSNFAFAGNQNFPVSNGSFTQPAKTVRVIQVRSAPSGEININKIQLTSGIGSSSCLGAKFSANGIIQTQPIMNLNQPASCFQLAVGASSALQKLSVTEKTSEKTIVVVATWPVQNIQAFSFKQAPFTSTTAIPAQVVSVMLIALVSLSIKRFVQRLSQKLSTIITSKFVFQMVMRC